MRFFEGNWTEYEEWMKANVGPEALEPHRVRYKPIAR
ncbi:hypothetical protein BH18ACT6_BH18ACT6_07540 [soil metagenome]